MKDINEIVKSVFNGVTPDDVLRFDGGKFIVGEQVLPQEDIQILQMQAMMIRDSYTWKLLMNNMKNLAIKRLAYDSKNYEDVYFGKAMLYELDVIQRSVESLANYQNGTRKLNEAKATSKTKSKKIEVN